MSPFVFVFVLGGSGGGGDSQAERPRAADPRRARLPAPPRAQVPRYERNDECACVVVVGGAGGDSRADGGVADALLARLFHRFALACAVACSCSPNNFILFSSLQSSVKSS